MKDSQILSGFYDAAAEPQVGAATASGTGPAPLETVGLGVVLRAVLMVEAVLAVAALFVTVDAADWLSWLGVLTAAVLPALMAWLLALHGLRRWLVRQPGAAQLGLALGLGALCGLYAGAWLGWMGLTERTPWLGSATAGVLLAAVLWSLLWWRRQALTPADALAQLASLQAHIRPHFLFNTLNSAVALVRQDPLKAERMLEDLSELFRVALAERPHAVTLAEELALARHYLDIEAVRFGERLRVDWRIDPSATAAQLPPLVLQPLVENAVKHGVEPSFSGAELRISVQRRDRLAVIKVTNTVPAGQGEPGHGLALDNVRQRLALLHDVQSRFAHACIDGVFQVRIEIPLPAEVP